MLNWKAHVISIVHFKVKNWYGRNEQAISIAVAKSEVYLGCTLVSSTLPTGHVRKSKSLKEKRKKEKTGRNGCRNKSKRKTVTRCAQQNKYYRGKKKVEDAKYIMVRKKYLKKKKKNKQTTIGL